MSAQTEQALHEAILAHARESGAAPGDLLVDWVVVTQSALAADSTADGYGCFRPTGQAYHRTLGLLHGAIDDLRYVNLRARDDDDAS